MTTKFNTRIMNKHATEADWLTVDFIPLSGELIIYDPDETHSSARFKIGNGNDDINILPFIDGFGGIDVIDAGSIAES